MVRWSSTAGVYNIITMVYIQNAAVGTKLFFYLLHRRCRVQREQFNPKKLKRIKQTKMPLKTRQRRLCDDNRCGKRLLPGTSRGDAVVYYVSARELWQSVKLQRKKITQIFVLEIFFNATGRQKIKINVFVLGYHSSCMKIVLRKVKPTFF